MLFPDVEVSVDVVRFEALAATGDRRPRRRSRPRPRSTSTGVTSCPTTSTSCGPRPAATSCGCDTSTCSACSSGGRPWWSSSPPTSWPTSRSCARFAADGDRHAGAPPVRAYWTGPCAGELGVAPGPEAVEMRDRFSATTTLCPVGPSDLVGRDRELGVLTPRTRRRRRRVGGRVVIVAGRRGHGEVRPGGREPRNGPASCGSAGRARCHRHGRGLVAVRAGAGSAGRSVPPAPDPAGRPGRPRPGRDRTSPRRGATWPGRGTDPPAAVRGRAAAGAAGGGHGRRPADHRRPPRCRRRQPAPPALPGPVHLRGSGLPGARPSAGAAGQRAGGGAAQPARPARREPRSWSDRSPPTGSMCWPEGWHRRSPTTSSAPSRPSAGALRSR